MGYLTDIFGTVNGLNISMQGHNQTIVGTAEKMSSFKHKLKLWQRQAREICSFCNCGRITRNMGGDNI